MERFTRSPNSDNGKDQAMLSEHAQRHRHAPQTGPELCEWAFRSESKHVVSTSLKIVTPDQLARMQKHLQIVLENTTNDQKRAKVALQLERVSRAISANDIQPIW